MRFVGLVVICTLGTVREYALFVLDVGLMPSASTAVF